MGLPFDTKKAWTVGRVAKPLLLSKTGVSEILRTLPAKPTPSELTKLKEAQKALESKMLDSKIKKEKKTAFVTTSSTIWPR